MSAYAAPGFFPPLELSFHSQCGFPSSPDSRSIMDGRLASPSSRYDSSARLVAVSVKGAKIDAAVLIQSMLQGNSNNHDTSSHVGARRRRPRVVPAGGTHPGPCYRPCAEDLAAQYELQFTGLSLVDAGGRSWTCRRSLARLIQFSHDLLAECRPGSSSDEDAAEAEARDPSRASGPAAIGSGAASGGGSGGRGAAALAAVPRLQDEAGFFFSTGATASAMTGVASRGLVVLQELLRSQAPLLEDWLQAAVRAADPNRSAAWKAFLAESDEEAVPALGALPGLSASGSRLSCERLGSIEESDTEYDDENEGAEVDF